MTEIDRIREEDWLPSYFFEPEKRCGFLITTERKEIWAILLDLYREFKRVCVENGLTFFAIGGTLLGAVRHGGFIPWDDDIDVAMPREDYERLKKLRDRFQKPYFLAWPKVEIENGFSFIKLRNSNTTGTSKNFSNLKINQGMVLDIFPIDDVNVLTYQLDYQRIKELLIENSSKMKELSKKREEDSTVQNEYNFLKNFEEVEEIAKKDNSKGYKHVAQRTITIYSHDKLLWDKVDFRDFIDLNFETEKIKVPIGYENILNVNYGNWREFPSIENRGTWHSSTIFDPRTPFNIKNL